MQDNNNTLIQSSSENGGGATIIEKNVFIDMDTLCYPKLQHLSQVMENIKGVENCITINHRPPFIYASYENVTSKLFPPIFQYTFLEKLSELFKSSENCENGLEYNRRMMRREIRGLAFDDESRKIVSRTMPKFFNVDEMEESSKKRVEYLLKLVMKDYSSSSGADSENSPLVLLEKLDGSLCSPIIERVVKSDDTSQSLQTSSLKKNNFASVSGEVIEKRPYDSFRLRMRTKLSHTNAIVMGMEEFVYGLGDEATRRNSNGEDIKVILNDHLKNIPTFEYKTVEMTSEEDEYLVFKIDETALENDTAFIALSDRVKKFVRFCIHWLNRGFTPLFEFFSREHKIVIDYGDQPFLSLLALRHTVDGYFLPYAEVKKSAQEYDIECVKECSNEEVLQAAKSGSVDEILKAIRNERGVEGYVMVLKNGWMFKVKSMWYNNIHKTNGFISKGELKESRIWQYCFDSKIDDVIGFVRREEDRVRLQEFNDTVINALNNYVSKVEQFKETIQQQLLLDFPNTPYEEISMKDFSKIAKQVVKDEPAYVLTALIVNKKDQSSSLTSLIKDHCSKNVVNQLGSIKNMLGCKDVEFISRSEMNRRAKLLKAAASTESVDNTNNNTTSTTGGEEQVGGDDDDSEDDC